MRELRNLAWYQIPEMGWRIMHISSRFPDRWHVTMLGAGMIDEVYPQSLKPVDPAAVRHIHSEERGSKQFECYLIAPPPGLPGAPFHWYVDINGSYAGGSEPTEADAMKKALDLIDEKAGPKKL